MGLTTVEEVIKLIELEDDENGSKAYGLKSALSNTAITKENHKTFEEVLEEKNEIDDLVNSDSETVKVSDIDSEIKNNNLENNSDDLKIEYEIPNQNDAISYEIPNQNDTITYQEPTINYQEPNNQEQPAMPQTLNDLINKANKG